MCLLFHKWDEIETKKGSPMTFIGYPYIEPMTLSTIETLYECIKCPRKKMVVETENGQKFKKNANFW